MADDEDPMDAEEWGTEYEDEELTCEELQAKA